MHYPELPKVTVAIVIVKMMMMMATVATVNIKVVFWAFIKP